ncbi:DUF5659 domain-containing protein [Clostridium paraputrificum]|nr:MULTISPECIES: DUF5659 domain-containing protein [Clostridium]MDB2089341.1 DUF5659 domain-containing protein [Clostridium paraputrificum]MDU1125156.1 DUF5659 domain-containing protein [Clostridium sp.]MDU1180052.1 DUF5659 domain-containing protein [Clostridium sp.]MDU1228107.1 DUF5659 domain-containing protein [Clostridium sp.]MDU3676177.1 DUF5659 domain-containing protein [Clostridium sp.]
MYVIKSKNLASFLIGKGFNLIKKDVDMTNSRYNVYLFKDTEELRNIINIWNKEIKALM